MTNPAIDNRELASNGLKSHPGPTNISYNALLIAGSVDPNLFAGYGGDAERAFREGFTGGDNDFIARATATSLVGINRILDRVVGTWYFL